MLIQRIITAVIGIPIALWIIYQGGIPLLLAAELIGLFGILEFAAMMQNKAIKVNRIIMMFFTLAFIALAASHLFREAAADLIVLLSLIAMVSLVLRFHTNKDAVLETAMMVYGTIYVGLLMSYLVAIRQLPDGFHLLITGIVCTWLTDTGAFFIGSSFGRHKLCPAVSPNKSIEGAIGGLLFCILGTVAFGIYWLQISIAAAIVLGLIIGTVSQFGDLAESAIKRFAGVKDSGKLLPGHGGVLDRFDSMLFVMPVLYYCIIYLRQFA